MKTYPAKLTRFGLFLFAASIPFSHVPAQFAIAFAVIGWVADGVLNGRWQVRWHFFFVPLIFYFVWNVLASLLSPRPAHSLAAVFDNEWPLLIMLMLFWTVRDTLTLKRIVQTLLLSAGVAMAYGIWQVFFGMDLYKGIPLTSTMGSFYRAVGFHGLYLTFAGFAMSIFFLSVGFLVESKSRGRWYYALSAALSFMAVLGTFARSIWLSFAGAIPLFAFSRNWKTGVAVTGTLAVLVVGGVLLVPEFRDRVFSIVDVSQNQTRVRLWKTAIHLAGDFPVTGVGEDNWDYYFESYKVEGPYDTKVHPHNDYLNVLVNAGIPGLIAFFAMWGITLTVGVRTAQRSKDPVVRAVVLGSTFSLLGFLVGSTFQNYYGTFINCLNWWFMVGLIFNAYSLGAPQESSAPPISA